MCGRFTQEYNTRRLTAFMRLLKTPPVELVARYNIAPTQHATVVVQPSPNAREARMLRWGLVPFWARDPSIGNRLINARAETLTEKPAFRAAVAKRRCVVPISGFYEWKARARGGQPYYIHGADSDILLLAGLGERWNASKARSVADEDGDLETFTIITTAPNAMMSRLHDRMPAILSQSQAEQWLDCEGVGVDSACALLAPASEGTLACHPVGSGVNSPKVDHAGLISPAGRDDLGLFEHP